MVITLPYYSLFVEWKVLDLQKKVHSSYNIVIPGKMKTTELLHHLGKEAIA